MRVLVRKGSAVEDIWPEVMMRAWMLSAWGVEMAVRRRENHCNCE